MLSNKDTVKAIEVMGEKFPDARTSLKADTDFHFLLAVILSAQTTDKAVNLLTPRLFARYPLPEDLAAANLEEVIPFLRSIGLYRNKGKYIIACAADIVAKFNGQVPQTRRELMQLSGVGRKTADVVLAECFNIPTIAVDTHVTRVSKRLHIVPQKADVLTIEKILMKKLPEDLWIKAHHCMIFWGRYQCMARKPLCEECPLLLMCAEGQKRVL
ncbi:endonuclease III [Liquorilactobacillus aquaticus DSM 21051]|uniref:Endonuclease III n=1 Tax=Liquorilactobacillus aquaticus DSM 21051 TaxID=1423725 RepID=A0A0R2DAW4_9LACO|nr:endonuclease III [Liquorilactobacillus aquaticus]KRM97500.1 endonuclease III [Liquorilactobacillus aquaticus DSM 21051]